MTSSRGRGLLHLAAALDQPGVYDAGPYVEQARLAERGGLDFVTLGDTGAGADTDVGASTGAGTFTGPGPDAAAVLARVAPATHRVGLVPTLTDARQVRTAVTALDRVSRGRAGWRTHALAGAWAGEAVDDTGRSIYVADATGGAARLAAARHADVALVRAVSADQARAVRRELRAEAVGSGREPESLRVLVSLLVDLGDGEYAAEPGHGGGGPRQSVRGPLYRGGPVDLAELIAAWHQDGTADGFHLVPVEPRRDLERLVNGTVALLQHRGLFRTFYPGSTLREHLGLARPTHSTVRAEQTDPVGKG
ncbi:MULTISPECIES: FMNH2-dependent monooxygenase [Streptomyces]|uniref:FMNH2-dependent monooxygenase n=2 Tax=Streptomyces TaxID=1883 RepID=A0ABV9J0R1_9ACTN